MDHLKSDPSLGYADAGSRNVSRFQTPTNTNKEQSKHRMFAVLSGVIASLVLILASVGSALSAEGVTQLTWFGYAASG